MPSFRLTYDEAALFNSYSEKHRRNLIDKIIRAEPYIQDHEAKQIARSLRYKMRDVSNEEYRALFNAIPLPTGI